MKLGSLLLGPAWTQTQGQRNNTLRLCLFASRQGLQSWMLHGSCSNTRLLTSARTGPGITLYSESIYALLHTKHTLHMSLLVDTGILLQCCCVHVHCLSIFIAEISAGAHIALNFPQHTTFSMRPLHQFPDRGSISEP